MAYELSQRIASGESALRLAGVLVGDGALDPLTQFTGFADLTYYMGFADINERATIQAYEGERICCGALVDSFPNDRSDCEVDWGARVDCGI
jgi:hypothetical protein